MKSRQILATVFALSAAASVPALARTVVDPAGPIAINPQPLPPIHDGAHVGPVAVNPQPLPPIHDGAHVGPVAVNPQPLPPILRDYGRSVEQPVPATSRLAGGEPPVVVDIERRKG